MAYTKKTTKPSVEVEANVEKIEDNVVATVEEVKTAKKYDKEDVIPCKSITNGKLLVTGEKSKILYRWANYGDIEDVEYQDLIYMIRSHKPSVYKPRFVIQDEEFIAQHPDLKDLYNSLYSVKDLKDILNLPATQMKKAINELPEGAFDAIRGVAASMINSGKYDSVAKIKELDEILNTKLLLTLAQN